MKSVKKCSESGQEASCSAAPAGDHDDVRLKGSVGERCSLERGRDGIAAQTILRVRVLAHDLESWSLSWNPRSTSWPFTIMYYASESPNCIANLLDSADLLEFLAAIPI